MTVIWPEDGMRARIAELEAENERLKARVIATEDDKNQRLDEMRAALAKQGLHVEDCHRQVEQAEAALAEWQQMYREMSAATETLREKLRCMAPSDTEARCLSMVEEITELRHRLDDDCTDCATGVEKHRRERAEAALQAADGRIWKAEADLADLHSSFMGNEAIHKAELLGCQWEQDYASGVGAVFFGLTLSLTDTLAERDSRLVRIVYLLENSRSYEAMVCARAEEGSGDELA